MISVGTLSIVILSNQRLIDTKALPTIRTMTVTTKKQCRLTMTIIATTATIATIMPSGTFLTFFFNI